MAIPPAQMPLELRHGGSLCTAGSSARPTEGSALAMRSLASRDGAFMDLRMAFEVPAASRRRCGQAKVVRAGRQAFGTGPDEDDQRGQRGFGVHAAIARAAHDAGFVEVFALMAAKVLLQPASPGLASSDRRRQPVTAAPSGRCAADRPVWHGATFVIAAMAPWPRSSRRPGCSGKANPAGA
ncbi:hypothetical protein [Poseidonocella sp. HB161398]|uniref:hypothetical protein n=1 Tax=Poseidonocella sp. HB161398 TaxID=2320855 RepID=UPI00110981F3|nr:hypothetical protein [Poseidonocella sp. HB161398]